MARITPGLLLSANTTNSSDTVYLGIEYWRILEMFLFLSRSETDISLIHILY